MIKLLGLSDKAGKIYTIEDNGAIVELDENTITDTPSCNNGNLVDFEYEGNNGKTYTVYFEKRKNCPVDEYTNEWDDVVDFDNPYSVEEA